MAWFKSIPWLSFVLLLITYITFGWYVDDGSRVLSEAILEQGKQWQWEHWLQWMNITEENAALGLVYALALLTILAITVGLIAPVALVTVAFGSGFKSDAWSIISILLWSFAIVFVLRWLVYFSQILLLLCAAILLKLDLQDNGYKGWQVFIIITVTCLAGFMGGAIAHSFYR